MKRPPPPGKVHWQAIDPAPGEVDWQTMDPAPPPDPTISSEWQLEAVTLKRPGARLLGTRSSEGWTGILRPDDKRRAVTGLEKPEATVGQLVAAAEAALDAFGGGR